MSFTRTLVLRAEKKPKNDYEPLGPHQIYRYPSLSIEQRELGPLSEGNIRVEIIFAGICGTDLGATQCDETTGYILGSAPLQIGPEGRVLGHEGVGRILEIGKGVNCLSLGDYVVLSSIITCFICAPCRRGNFNQCENSILFGMESDGLFATIVDVPVQLAYKVNNLAKMEFGLKAAACIEPAGCGYVAATSAKISPGDNVLIFGGGPIGIFTAMLCKNIFGAAKVSIVEPVQFRRKLASKWADHTYDVHDYFSNTRDHSYNVLIEASGVMENINRAFPSMLPNSRVVLLARSGDPLSIQHVDHMITNNITILGSRGHLTGAFDSLITLYAAGRLPLHEVVTEIVEDIDGLRASLGSPEIIQRQNCKVLAQLNK